jgi:multiple sugar transport system permease protein
MDNSFCNNGGEFMRQATVNRKSFFTKFEGLFWLMPFLIPYAIFTLAMLIMSFTLSFTDYKILGDKRFIGFDNYTTLFADAIFWQSLRNTIVYVLASTPVLILVPLAIGIFIEHRQLVSRSFFRITFFAPFVLPVSVVAYTFLYMFQPYTGLVNNLIKTIGLLGAKEEIFWITQSNMAWITIIVETLWWTGGFNLILYIAGMQEIPDHYYESADLDGCNFLNKVRYITIPLLNRVHVTVLFLQLVASFKVFGQVFLLTGGGPGGATRTYIQYLYEVSFRSFKIGRGSAAAFVLFLLILIISALQFKATSKFSKE